MKENIKLGLILLLITGIAAMLLGGAYEITKAPIEKQIAENRQAAMKEILPLADASLMQINTTAGAQRDTRVQR